MKRLAKILFLYFPAGLILISVFQVVLLKWVPVVTTPLMVMRSIGNEGNERIPVTCKWKSYDEISPNMARAVIACEDNKFFTHHGFDFEELKKMKEKYDKKGGKLRGCSTISQQTAKNCFTLCSHTWLRKGVEAYYTVLIELIWGKKRILEVYLNIVELGHGIYGSEAAAQKYYGKPASELTLGQAVSLACCLPNPLKRSPSWVDAHMSSYKSTIITRCGDIFFPEQ